MPEGAVAAMGWKERFRAKPFVFWMVAACLAYLAFSWIVILSIYATSITDPFVVTFGVVALLFVVAAYGAFAGKRWGFVAGIVLTILTLLLISFTIGSSYSNPAYPAAPLTVSGVPIALLAIALSILTLRKWKGGVQSDANLTAVRSTGGLVSMAVVGFAAGSLLVSVSAAPLIVSILSGSGQAADIRIVPNAPSAVEPFVPANFSAVLGPGGSVTVTWFNGDANEHTVTSDTGAFGSPLLSPGARYSFTFTRAGTYTYHCEPHPNMRGTVFVT